MTIEATSEPGAGEAGGETPGEGIVVETSGFGSIRRIACHPSQPAAASKSAANAEPKMSVEDLGRKEGIAATKRRQRPAVEERAPASANTQDFSAIYAASPST